MMNNSALEFLTPLNNCTLILIDHQPKIFFDVEPENQQSMKNDIVGLTKAAKKFQVPHTGAYGIGLCYAKAMVR